MTQLIVTIDDLKLVPDLKKNIASMRGVKSIRIYQPGRIRKPAGKTEDIPQALLNLVGIASDATEYIDSDDRLSYILDK